MRFCCFGNMYNAYSANVPWQIYCVENAFAESLNKNFTVEISASVGRTLIYLERHNVKNPPQRFAYINRISSLRSGYNMCIGIEFLIG